MVSTVSCLGKLLNVGVAWGGGSSVAEGVLGKVPEAVNARTGVRTFSSRHT